MSTYTIAQALATNATGIVVVDTPANIASALPNASLVSRVSAFEMSAAASVAAWQAQNLATLGSAFSMNGFKLTIRDTVASLTNSAYAAGLAISGAVIAVYDTAANILAGASNSIVRNASSIALSANATLTLSQLLTLETWPSFTAAGLTLTLADSAANLLALTTPEQKPTLTIFQVSISSTVTAAQALTLGAMSHFSVVGATLTIADTIANLTANASALAAVMALSGVVEVVADTVINLLGQTSALTTLEGTMPHLTVSLAGNDKATVAQLALLAALPGFRAGTGNTLTAADTVQNLLTLTAPQKALIQATALSGNGTANATQLVQLAGLPVFARGSGHTLVVTDTLANLAALTATQTALASSTAVDDTLTNVVAAQAAHSTVLSAAGAVTVELDGSSVSVAQLTSLQTLPGFSLHANLTSSTLTIADTVTNLLGLTTPQKALIQATTLSVNGATNATQLQQLSALPSFTAGSGHTLVVTDTIANLGALTAPQRALASSSTVDDTVTNILAAQTAHSTVLSAASAVTAELDGNNISVAQLASLLTLPGITLHANGTSSTLTVADTVVDLLTLTTPQKALIQATTLPGNDTANAAQLAQLAALPSFTRGTGHTLVATDTLANLAGLTTPQRALTTSTVVDDTLTNVVAAQAAHSTTLSAAGAVTVELDGNSISVAQLTSLQTLPGFTLHANLTSSTLTVADTVTNLLTLTTPQKALIQATTLSAGGSANAAQLEQLAALPSFSRGSGHTLVVTDTLANIGTLTTPQRALASSSAVDDTVTNILSAQTAHSTVLSAASSVTAELDGNNISAAQLTSLLTLPGITLHANVTSSTLTIADSVVDLLTLTAPQKALIQATTLPGNDTANATQLVQLAALPSFTRGTGHTLVTTDTLANLATLTAAQTALASSTVVDDTLSNILTAQTAHSTTLSAAGAVTVELDGTSVTIAQGQSLLALPGLKLHANGGNTSLVVADTIQDLAAGASTLTALAADGPVTESVTNNNAILTASAAASLTGLSGFNAANYVLAIADTGSATTTYASQIFGKGFEAITVTSGTFAGSMAQLLDPSLRLLSGSAAQLNANAAPGAAQVMSLAALPGFSVATGVTVAVQDQIASLVADATTLARFATSIVVTDSESVSVAGATSLASLQTAVGSLHFSFGTHDTLTIADTAQNILAASAGAVTLASSVVLTSDAHTNEAAAAQLAGLGSKFANGGYFITVADSASALVTLASTPATLAVVNGWIGAATLNGTGSVTAANAALLQQFTGFSRGGYQLVISDTAADLLNPANASAIALGTSVQLSQPIAESAANAAALVAIRGFTAGGLSVSDTPTALAGITPAVAAFLSGATLAAETGGNTAAYTVSAAQMTAVLALPNFSMSTFTGTVTVKDTAAAMAAFAPTVEALSAGVQMQFASMLSGDATVSAATATILAGLPSPTNGGHVLTVQDTPTALLAVANTAGVALGSVVDVSAPVAISVTTANQLAALHGFVADGYPITIADTPANLATLTGATLAIAAQESVLPYSIANTSDYSLNTMQFGALVGLANLSWAGFSGPLIVQDTAANLASFETSLTAAAAGSALSLSHGIISTALSQNATNIAASMLLQLEALPGFALGGHTLTVEDTATALLSDFQGSNVPFASGVTLAANTGAWVVNASDATRLADMPGFSAGSSGIQVQDNAIGILTPANAAGVSAASSVLLDAAALVSVSQAEALEALHGFSRNGQSFTISDSETNLATLDAATAALATSIQILGTPDVSVSQYDALVAAPGFLTSSNAVIIADTAADLLPLVGQTLTNVSSIMVQPSSSVTAGQAQSLSTLANLLTGNNLTVSDSVADFVQTSNGTQPIDAAGEQLASQVTMNGDGTISVAQGAMLASLGTRFSNGSFHLVLEDTPTNLITAATSLGAIMSQVTSTVLSSNGGTPWSVTLGQAAQLATLPTLSTGVSGVIVQDNVTNILYPGYATLVSEVPSITLNANATGNSSVNVAQAEALHALSNFSLGGFQLNILDGAGHLATLDAGTAAMATSIQLQGSALVSVAQFIDIRNLPGTYTDNGKLLVVNDTAGNLEGLTGSLSLASEIMLSTSVGNLSAATAEQLASLPNFTTGIAHMAVVDTAADLVAGSGSLPTDWAGEMAATSVTLSASAIAITAAQADDLALLGGRFSNGGNALTVQDTVANLVSSANAAGVALATAVTLKQNETGVSVANWAQVSALPDFSKGTYSVGISDTAADIAAASPSLLAQANTVQLSSAVTLTVAATESLVGISNFVANAAAPITIADTLPNLLLLSGNSNAILTAASIELSANALVTVAQLATLATLPQYSTFSTNSFTITVEDSGAHLAAYTPDTIAVPTSYVMIGDATLTPTQGNALVRENVSIGDNHLTIASDPTTLLSLGTSLNALATGLTLNGASSATTTQAIALEQDGRFTTGGDAFTVTGSASALLSFNASYPLLATTLALSESGDIIHASDLQSLAELGTKFALAGNTMTVTDTAASLAALNSFETALVHAEVLQDSESVNATTAAELGALPNFSLGSAVTLTVTGTYAELTALPASIQSIATLELTGGSELPLTAAQAATLGALSNFSPAADIVVQDTIGDLVSGANTGWQRVATGGYIVTDSVSNLLDNISNSLLSAANSVTLLGDAQVDAADFASLAGLTNFSRGTAALVVQDSAAAIAAAATSIGAVASSALVDSAAPVSAAAAEALAGLNALHMLNFAGGVSLAAQDLFSTIQSGSYTAGLALAHTITAQGSATDLVTATSFAWPGTAIVSYQLNIGGNILAQTATTLHGLGSKYLPDGYTLTVVDNSSDVVGATTAIEALGLAVQVNDTVAEVDAETAGLVALGTTLQSITLTDMTAVQAAPAAALVPLLGKLTGSPIAVSDTALAVDGSLAALQTLGAHISSITVHDSVVNLAPYASALSVLGSELLISLTDTPPISVHANIAADLVPLVTQLASVTINVSDTGAAIGAAAATLADLTELGTITLSDGTTVTATIATELQPIDSHLGLGVTLNVADSAAAIAGAATSLVLLSDDGRLGTVTSDGQLAADIVTYGATLVGLGATATINDTAENVSANLDALEPFSGVNGLLRGITLSDNADIAVSIGQFTTDANVLALIGGSFKYAITDSSTHIANDLGAGAESNILNLGAQVHTITVTGGTLSIDAGTLLASGVDAALANLAGGTQIAATGVTITDFTGLDLLAIQPNSYAVADSGSNIGGDLNLGTGNSALLTHLGDITGIVPTGTVTINYAAATTQYVDDGAGSVFSLMPDATLEVTGVMISNIPAMLGLAVPAALVAVTDDAIDIQNDLGGSSPALVQYLAKIDTITVSLAGTITLDADHALATHVDDGAGSVFGKMTGGTLDVTGAEVGQLVALYDLYQRPATVAVSDEATSIASDLQNGATSVLETYVGEGFVSGVTVLDGPVVLDYSYDVGAIASALAALPLGSLQVTNVPIADIVAVTELYAFASMTVSTDVATLAANLGAGSPLATYAGSIRGMTITDGPLVLSDAAAKAADPTALGTLPADGLDVTGVAVGDVAYIAGIGALASMTVSDSAANLATDLRLVSSSSELDQHATNITSIMVNDVGAVAAADAATISTVVGKLTGPAFAVSDLAAAVDTALSGLETLGSHISTVTVSDSAADVAPYAQDLIALGSKLVVSLTDGTTFTTGAQIAAELEPLAAKLTGSTINVTSTGSAIAQYAATLAELGGLLGTVTLSDGDNTNAATAAGLTPIANNLGNDVTINVSDSASAIAGAAGLLTLQSDERLGTVTSDGQLAADIVTYGATLVGLGATATINDTAENVSANLDALEPFSGVNGLLRGITLSDNADIAVSIGQFTTDANVLALIGGSFKYAITDSSTHIANDLGAGVESNILNLGAQVHTITVTGGTLSIDAGTLLASGVDAALANLAGGTQIAATGVTITDFTGLDLLAIQPNSYAVADSGSNIGGDLNLGTGNSALLTHLGDITGIVPTGTVTINYAAATTQYVDDGAGSVFSLMPDATLEVTGVMISNIPAMLGLAVPAALVAVTDDAIDIQNDLGGSSPALVQYLAKIDTITVSLAGTITLDADHALATHVDDGAGSVFGKMTGGTLDVTGAEVGQLVALYDLYQRPATVAVSDEATSIASDLQNGATSVLETYVGEGFVSGVTVLDGPVVLDYSYDVGAIASALAALPADSLKVTNVPIGDIESVATELSAFASMTVSTNVATLAANLSAGSPLALYATSITSMTITDGPLVLTDAAAKAADPTALSTLPSDGLDVTGVAVGDVAYIAGIAALASMTVSDDHGTITTDLQKGSALSVLELKAAEISTITVTGGSVSLSDGEAQLVTDALAKLSEGSLIVTGASVANASTYGGMTALLSMTVSDSEFNVHQDLVAGTSVLETYAATGTLTGITVTDALLPLTDQQAENVLDALAILGGGHGLTVSGVSVADIPNIGVLGALTSMTVTDEASAIHDDLVKNTSSDLYIYRSAITGMTVDDGPVEILGTEQSDVQYAALALLPAGSLLMDDVEVIHAATAAGLTGLIHMTVSDTGGAVQTDLSTGGHDLETHFAKIESITVSSQVTLDWTYAGVDMDALALLAGTDTLVVTNVPVADVAAVAGLSALDHMTVSDTNTDIANNTATLEQYATSISTIAISGGGAVSIAGSVAALAMDALAKLPDSSLIVTDALAAQAGALGALASLQSMTITDTGSDIASALPTIEEYSTKVTSITITSGTIELEYSVAALVLSALAAMAPGKVTVDDVPIGHITDITDIGAALLGMTVTNDGGTISTDLASGVDSVIESNISSITAINVSSGSVSLTDAQADLVLGALAVLQSASTTITGVPVGSDIPAFFAYASVAGMAISDTAGNVQTDLISGGLIAAAVSKITSIDIGGGTVALNDGQADAVLAALAKLTDGSLTVSGVPVLDVATIGGLTTLTSMAVYDDGGTISTNLGNGATSSIYTHRSKISGITLSGGAVSISDGAADAVFAALGLLPNGSLTVTAVPLSDAAHIHTLGATLSGMAVSDLAATIQSDLTSGSTITTNAGKINSITPSDTQVSLTDSQADAVLGVLNKLAGGSLLVTGVSVSDIINIGPLTSLAHMTVVDAAATINTDLALGGTSQILGSISEISSVAANDTMVDALTAASIYDVLSTKFDESTLVIADSGANIVTVANGADAAVLARAASVQLDANVVSMDAADATTLAGVLKGTQTAATVNVVDNAADILAPANVAGIALATSVGVSDTAADILAYAPELIAMGSKLVSTHITDGGPLSASAVTDLLELPGLSAGALIISDTGSQIAAAIELNGGTGVSFLNAHTVELSGNSTITASDAAALGLLSDLVKGIYTINVSDTATHLTDSVDGYFAAVKNTSLIDGVYLKTTGGTVTVTAATAAALTTIPNFSKNPISGGPNTLIVQDTAAHFDTSYATLYANLSLFDHLYVSSSATITDTVYGELLNLGVHALNGGVAVTVRDSATTIAANANAQLGGSPSITPLAWQLSGSSAVTEVQAATLGALLGFSAGAFTLTLSASVTGVSVSAANALGALGTAFHLGGFSVGVSGSVSTLSGLSAGALAVVTLLIQDTFSNVASGLTASSPLLSGAMQVTDSEAISVLQATEFFALIKTGSGAGIPAANVSFTGGVETITDTLANVQTLTQDSASWAANTSLHSDFHLVVADTVGNLILPANTTALAAMSGTTLAPTEAPVNAQSLESLFALENTINFARGTGQVTLQDTVANLLNPSYSDAITLANQITLAGPDTTNAAGAETLMATSKLVLTGSTILTISDTSTDLLDGVLGPAISGGSFTNYVHVVLSDDETLDAGTAEALVTLPGYTTGSFSLSIVDGASYLLNAANHPAEADATSVTLDGDADVSAATAVALVGLPHFALDGNTLYLASNDYANAATLTTLAGLGSGFNLNGNTLTMTQNASVNAQQLAAIGDFSSGLVTAGHSLTLTQDALSLSPTEYTALQSDNVVPAGHVWSAIPTGVTVSEVSNNVEFDGTGVNSATVTLYSAAGTVLTTTSASPGFTISAAESGSGINVVATETPLGGNESAPIIALEQTILTNAASADHVSFAASGDVQVTGGEFMNLYTAGSQPGSPSNPELIYDPSAHTLSYVDGVNTIVLVTLGAATHPASLDASEIFVKHYA